MEGMEIEVFREREKDMIPVITVVGIDVSRDWLDGFCLPDERRFQFPNTATGHEELIALIGQLPGPVAVGFEATGGLEWRLWTKLEAAGIDAALIARFLVFRPDARRRLATEKSAFSGP